MPSVWNMDCFLITTVLWPYPEATLKLIGLIITTIALIIGTRRKLVKGFGSNLEFRKPHNLGI
jgi:hypothetical protein